MMSPVDRDVLRRKLSRIIQCLQRIKAAEEVDLDDYTADADLQSILERQLELAVGAAVDLNVHFLVSSGFSTPADAYTSFTDLARHTQAIPMELALRLAPAAGLRNRLVHQYEEINHELVYQGLHDALDLFPTYVSAIETYLERAK
jgi:uncharacterized protein YutE (UPF0331/DUF86 family)